MLKGKSHHQWSSNIFRHYKDAGKGMLEDPSHVQVELVCKYFTTPQKKNRKNKSTAEMRFTKNVIKTQQTIRFSQYKNS